MTASPNAPATLAALTTALAGRYRVEREIGAGGMATVYLARDEKHDRRVAVKVLHPDLAATIGAERFLAEIRTTANLQHPHILPLHDSGEANGLLFYVMPFVDGESLRDRLERERQLPIDDAVRIAQQVANALDYAHRQQVVHRDIKPENVLLHEGSALVADFGIALAVQTASGQRMTQTGLSLGTPQYMSPEQAMGDKHIDARSDVYSLAAVTYEMLSGEPPFTGATVQAIVAKVLAAEPEPVTTTRRSVPGGVAAAVHRGLEKVPADRYATAAEFAAALSRADTVTGAPPARDATTATVARTGLPRMAGIGAGMLIIAGGAFVAGRMTSRGTSDVGEPIVATLAPSEGETWHTGGTRFSVSPDGRRVVVASGDSLVVRSLDSLGSVPLRNTKGADYPFWSRDGKSVGFFADKQLKVVDVATGAMRGLCAAAKPSGGTWGADGTILYTPDGVAGLYRASASNGGCEHLKIALPASALGGRPYFFPDARHFLLTTDGAAFIGEVGRDSVTQLTTLPRVRAVFAAPDYLLYEPQGSARGDIFARRIDVGSRRLVGDPVKVLEDVPHGGGNTSLSAALNGTIVARVQGTVGSSVIGRFARGGAIVDTQPNPGFGPFRVSHDGRRRVTGGFAIDVADLERRIVTPLVAETPARTLAQFGQWAPGDTAIAYVFRDSAVARIEVIATGTGARRTLAANFPAVRGPVLEDWTSDGRYLVYTLPPAGAARAYEVWIYDLSTQQARRLFDVDESGGSIRVSPNMRTVAYVLDTTVFVRPFPAGGAPVRISPSRGYSPRWRADSRELFYNDTAGAIMAVPMRDDGKPAGLPQTAVAGSTIRALPNTRKLIFEPAPDGKSFHVAFILATGRGPAALTLLTNWWKHAGIAARR